MTITEAAKQYGVSKQAIYQRAKREQISLDSIRDPATGSLTAYGEEWMAGSYQTYTDPQAAMKDRIEDVNSLLVQAQRRSEEYRQAAEAASAQLVQAEARIGELTRLNGELQQQVIALTGSVSAMTVALENFSRQPLLLPEPRRKKKKDKKRKHKKK